MATPLRKLAPFLLCIAFSARADDANYNNILVGERAFGMAGAFTALADDSSGLYYNPAGVVDCNHDSFSLSGTVWGLQNVAVKDGFKGIDPKAKQDFNSNVLKPIPSTLALLNRLSSRLAVGFNAIVYDQKETNINEQESLSAKDTGTSFSREMLFIRRTTDQILFVGPGVGLRLTDKLSVGVSVFGVLRSFDDNITTGSSAMFQKQTISSVNLSQGISLNNKAVLSVIGLKYSFSENIKLGAALRTRSWRFSTFDKGQVFSVTSSYDRTQVDAAADKVAANGDRSGLYQNIPTFGSKDETQGISGGFVIPMQATVGIAFTEHRKYTVASDVAYTRGYKFNLLNIEGFKKEQIPLGRVDQNDVINARIGGEYYATESIPVRLGAYTNYSSAPKVKRGDYSLQDQVNIFGLTFGTGTENEQSSTNIGFAYAFGTGKGESQFGKEINTISVSNLNFFLGGSYYF